jgi:hypothetical protein
VHELAHQWFGDSVSVQHCGQGRFVIIGVPRWWFGSAQARRTRYPKLISVIAGKKRVPGSRRTALPPLEHPTDGVHEDHRPRARPGNGVDFRRWLSLTATGSTSKHVMNARIAGVRRRGTFIVWSPELTSLKQRLFTLSGDLLADSAQHVPTIPGDPLLCTM